MLCLYIYYIYYIYIYNILYYRIYIYIYVNKLILVLDVVVQMIPALLVVPGPFDHGGRRTLLFAHAWGLEP